MKLEEKYWKENFSEPETMDGIGNAREHAQYLHALFALEEVEIDSIVDLGFGLGFLFNEMIKTFGPKRALGIEPSAHAFARVQKGEFFFECPQGTHLRLFQESIEQWCERKRKDFTKFDLGLCTSVFQYMEKDVLEKVLPELSKRIKYLYLTVPTDKELKRQVKELEFKDRYALKRSQEEYLELLHPYFAIVSSRLVESRHYFSEKDTAFTNLLYRF